MKREGFYAEQLQIDKYQHDRLILSKRTCEWCLALAIGSAGGMLIAWGCW